MTTVKIKQSVSHDRYHLHQGEVVKLPNGVAQQLIGAGFAEETGEPADDAEDLVGGKMDAPVENKMDVAPISNKAVKTTKAD